MSKDAPKPMETPPLEPNDETAAGDYTDFAADCAAAVVGIQSCFPQGWVLGKPRITRSDVWGLVWRADLRFPGEPPGGLVNRLVVWRGTGPGGLLVAVGQDIAPLPD